MIEALESRQLCSYTLNLNEGTQRIEIVGSANGDEITVEVRPKTANGQTYREVMVNGTDHSFPFATPTVGVAVIIIVGGGGGDTLTFNQFSDPEELNVYIGGEGGNDIITIDGTDGSAHLGAEGGDGDDQIHVFDAMGHCGISGNNGNDVFKLVMTRDLATIFVGDLVGDNALYIGNTLVGYEPGPGGTTIDNKLGNGQFEGFVIRDKDGNGAHTDGYWWQDELQPEILLRAQA